MDEHLKAEHPVDLMALLAGQLVQGLGDHAGVLFMKGIPVALQVVKGGAPDVEVL